MLNKEQATLREYPLALIMANLTRWTSHCLSTERFISLEGEFKSVVVKQEAGLVLAAGGKRPAKEKARQIISSIQDVNLWSNLRL